MSGAGEAVKSLEEIFPGAPEQRHSEDALASEMRIRSEGLGFRGSCQLLQAPGNRGSGCGCGAGRPGCTPSPSALGSSKGLQVQHFIDEDACLELAVLFILRP